MTQTLKIRDLHLILHPSGGLYLEEQALLIISDAHLGKISHFRKAGSAVPVRAIHRNYEALEATVNFFSPQKICFLGDLFHSYINKEWLYFEAWMERSVPQVILVSGNHDIISPIRYESLGINVVPRLVQDGFLMTHYPEEPSGFFNISGHVHPAVRLRGNGRQSLRLPCFFKRGNQIILPAFGAFTGTHLMEVAADDEVFAIADASVIKI